MTGFIERQDGPNHTRTDVFPTGRQTGIIVEQSYFPIGHIARIFVPFEDWPQVREMMQAVYDKHAPKKEDKE